MDSMVLVWKTGMAVVVASVKMYLKLNSNYDDASQRSFRCKLRLKSETALMNAYLLDTLWL